MTTDDERLERIRALRTEMDAKRAELFKEIREAFHENRGEPQVRGWLAKVAKASEYTREYVAQIRDGKTKE
jgi:predicted transcriptional regulator